MIAQTLQYGPERIHYRVAYVPVTTTKIAIHVLPTGLVRVDAPHGVSLAAIKNGVEKRARWLNSHINKIQQRKLHVLPKDYVSGESHLYLGRRYLLKVKQIADETPSVKLRQGRLEVTTHAGDRDTVRLLLSGWYRVRARLVFQERLDRITARSTSLRKVTSWKLRVMKRQWGSCSPSGRLSLNPHLLKAPPACIDYVLLHEICHLKHHNHSKSFYRMLHRHLPRWQAIKSRLDEMAEQIL